MVDTKETTKFSKKIRQCQGCQKEWKNSLTNDKDFDEGIIEEEWLCDRHGKEIDKLIKKYGCWWMNGKEFKRLVDCSEHKGKDGKNGICLETTIWGEEENKEFINNGN